MNEMHDKVIKWGIKDLTSEEEQDQGRKTLGNEVWSERRVWEGERSKSIERDREEMNKNCADPLNRNFINLDRSRCVERCWEFKRRFLAVEELSRIYREVSIAKESRWIEEAIERLLSNQKVSRWIKQLSRSYRECDKKQLKGLNR